MSPTSQALALRCIFLLVAITGCTVIIDRYAPSSGAPTITKLTSAPALLRIGETLTVQVAANQAVSTCNVSVAGQTLTCVAEASGCTCNDIVSTATSEGAATVVATVGNDNGTGTANATVQVDLAAPGINVALVAIQRTPAGQSDALLIPAGAVADPSPSYSG